MSRNKAKQKVSFSFVPRLGTASFNSLEAAKSSNCTFYATRKQGANARLRSSELRFFSLFSFSSFIIQIQPAGATDGDNGPPSVHDSLHLLEKVLVKTCYTLFTNYIVIHFILRRVLITQRKAKIDLLCDVAALGSHPAHLGRGRASPAHASVLAALPNGVVLFELV